MDIVISSGHSLKVRGAAGPEPWGLDEVDEARRVVERVAQVLRNGGDNVKVFHDNTSTTQEQNLNTIVNFHNAQERNLDVSVHFNAYQETSKPMGCEVLYVSQGDLAADVSDAIAQAGGFIDRGPKKRTDLYFLNNTEAPAILIETCFVDSEADADLYRENFNTICQAIAGAISGELNEAPDLPPPAEQNVQTFRGKCSWFGGPDDMGVSSSEGLAFIYNYSDAPHLFLPEAPTGCTGLARRLNPGIHYVACRWDYDVVPKAGLADPSYQALVKAGDRAFLAWPADWGPHEDTGRVADVSPALLYALGIETDDEVEVIYPAPDMAWT